MENQRAKLLIKKYLAGDCTAQERAIVETWYNEEIDREPFKDEQDYEAIGSEIWKSIPRTSGTVRRLWPKIAIASSVLLCLSYLLLLKSTEAPVPKKTIILPGRAQATLTLANGKKILLSSGLKGTLAYQGNTKIEMTNDNAVRYSDVDLVANDHVAVNTLSTGKGERSPFPLVLSDGSKVWLNAESSISFPTVFHAHDRIVKLSGEAFFEIAHKTNQPFQVQTQSQVIEDLGTVFNVNSYKGKDGTFTTLLEGAVRVNGIILKPSEQTDGESVKKVNVAKFTAWKNGDFYFQDDNIKDIMQQISRWYDVEIVYQGNISNEGLTARISLDKNINAVLKMLENTKAVHFKIQGRRVTVIQ